MKRHIAEKLPPALLQELNSKLVDNGYGNYEALAFWLKSNGHNVSKSSIHRYAQTLKAAADHTAPTSGIRDVFLRMRCVESSVAVTPACKVLDFASELFFWVTTGRRR